MSAFETYEPSDDGGICLKTDTLSDVLGYATHARHSDSGLKATCEFEAERLVRISIVIDTWGSSTHVLRHIPDAMLPDRPKIDFGTAARFTTSSPKMLREITDAMGSAADIRVKFGAGSVIAFIDAAIKGHEFRPAGLRSSGTAETLLPLVSLDFASKIVEHADPTAAEMAVLDGGLAKIAYTFPHVTLEYLAAPVVESL